MLDFVINNEITSDYDTNYIKYNDHCNADGLLRLILKINDKCNYD